MRVLIVATSARALAQSARRAGWEPIAVDAFADRDLRAQAKAWRCVRWQEREILRAALWLWRKTQAPLWLYGGGIEVFPQLVASLSRKMVLRGNPAKTLCQIIPFPRLAAKLIRLEIPFPRVARSARFPRWLYKCGGSGGVGVFRSATCKGGYWQQRLTGQVYTLAFLTDGRRLFWSALHRLETCALGKHPALFQVLFGPVSLPCALMLQARRIARRLIRRFRLRGWNSFDLIVHRGKLYLIDLNPRPGAALNLWDDLFPEGAMAAHLEASVGRKVVPKAPSEMRGYGVVWTKRRWNVSSPKWPEGAVDLPVQSTLPPRRPVCGLLLRGENLAELKFQFQKRSRTVLQ